MGKALVLGGLTAGLAAAPGWTQSVPEGVHSYARGPAEMCGLAGRDAIELIERVRASPAHRSEPISTARFELYVSIEGMDQFVFTRPSEAAHPAVTCRHVFQDASGNWLQERSMRCEASRAACDALFIEFQELDERLRRDLSGDR